MWSVDTHVRRLGLVLKAAWNVEKHKVEDNMVENSVKWNICPLGEMDHEAIFIFRGRAQWLVSELRLNLAAAKKCPSTGAGAIR